MTEMYENVKIKLKEYLKTKNIDANEITANNLKDYVSEKIY